MKIVEDEPESSDGASDQSLIPRLVSIILSGTGAAAEAAWKIFQEILARNPQPPEAQ